MLSIFLREKTRSRWCRYRELHSHSVQRRVHRRDWYYLKLLYLDPSWHGILTRARTEKRKFSSTSFFQFRIFPSKCLHKKMRGEDVIKHFFVFPNECRPFATRRGHCPGRWTEISKAERPIFAGILQRQKRSQSERVDVFSRRWRMEKWRRVASARGRW